MYQEEYEDGCECDFEEAASESANVKAKVNGKGKVNVDFDISKFMEVVSGEIACEIKAGIKQEINSEVKKEIMSYLFGEDSDLEEFKKTIRLECSKIVQEIINDFIENEKITVGGGWDEEAKEYTLKGYAKKCIKDNIQDGKFEVFDGVEKRSYGRGYTTKTKQYKFNEYIQAQLGIGNETREYIDKQILEVRDNVNSGIKEMFNQSTKNLLSETILNVLSANSTYKKIQESIGQIANNTNKK